MPKMKTHRGAAKRFRLTGSGKLVRRKAYKAHLLGNKSGNQKNRLSKTVEVSKADNQRIRRVLGI